MTKNALSAAAPPLSNTFLCWRAAARQLRRRLQAPRAAAKILRFGQNYQFPLRLFEVLEGWDPGVKSRVDPRTADEPP